MGILCGGCRNTTIKEAPTLSDRSLFSGLGRSLGSLRSQQLCELLGVGAALLRHGTTLVRHAVHVDRLAIAGEKHLVNVSSLALVQSELVEADGLTIVTLNGDFDGIDSALGAGGSRKDCSTMDIAISNW